METILVTGGAGYIGSHIVDKLCESDFNVIVLDNLSNGFRESLHPNAKFIIGDITNDADLDLTFSNNKISSIIHLAAFKSIAESIKYPKKYLENNIVGSINLILKARQYKIRKFIFSSTAAVYGYPKDSSIDEKHPTAPMNFYGYTKLCIENYLDLITKNSSMKCLSFRYFNAGGYSKNRRISNYKDKNPENLLPILMEGALNKEKIIEVFGSDYDTKDGTCIRDYVHVLDLAEAHVKGINHLENNNSDIINLSSGKGSSVLEVINLVEKISKQKIYYKISNRRAGDPPELVSCYNKAQKVLNWNPKKSIDDIISSMWEAYSNR